MKKEKRIYCIEGIHDWGARDIEPTIDPMLKMLSDGVGLWKFVRRDCATEGELKWYLGQEWYSRCSEGSVLYFCSHGSPAVVDLSDSDGFDLGQLALQLEPDGCQGCHVHFGGCSTFKDLKRVKDFADRTKAWAVSGYENESDWIGIESNGLALEYALLSSIAANSNDPIEIGNNRHKQRLRKVEKSLKKAFPDLGFRILIS